MELKERFLKYVAINTRSDENSDTFPSTAVQWDLLNALVEEMKLLGLDDRQVWIRYGNYPCHTR